MIDLSQLPSASPLVHSVPTDLGTSWVKDTDVAIDVPPDTEVNPLPESQWPANATRTGVYGAVSPRVVALPYAGYRMYYTQILPRPGFPAGANDYYNATSRILSATSSDGSMWIPDPGVRLSPEEGGAGKFRVASSEVVPMAGADGPLRMYYECARGPQSEPNSIRSAVAEDGGLVWTREEGVRFSGGGCYQSPRIVLLDEGRYRLYCCEWGRGIISALSDDGLTFHQDPGLRIASDGAYDAHVAFAPEIMRLADGMSYVMYYVGYSTPNRAYILRAVSDDGLTWRKDAEPVISPGHSVWDAVKCSEVCVFRLPDCQGQAPRYRMVYEGCDGTAKDDRGVWRIVSATSVVRSSM